MANFFIRRPIVAIVIAILTALGTEAKGVQFGRGTAAVPAGAHPA